MGAKNIALFASGAGSNVKNILKYFGDKPFVNVGLVVSSRSTAGVISIAREAGVPVEVLVGPAAYESNDIIEILHKHRIDVIVLAGFLLKIPDSLIQLYHDRIINIHPALLPKYGGKGMYGKYVHEAVRAANDATTGITIHLVNEHYDEGRILFQATCDIAPGDTPEQIAAKVQELEHKHYPVIIEKFLNDEL